MTRRIVNQRNGETENRGISRDYFDFHSLLIDTQVSIAFDSICHSFLLIKRRQGEAGHGDLIAPSRRFSPSPFHRFNFSFPQSSIANHQSKGHEALMVVPFPLTDSTPKLPPESSVRAFMLKSPNPPQGALPASTSLGSNPMPLSAITNSTL